MFRDIFSFRGRIRRTEYGMTYFAYFLWSVRGNPHEIDEIGKPLND